MDEKRMFQLIKAAAELEELHAAVEGRPPEPVSPVRPRRRRRWLLLAAPLAAAALALIFRPPALHLEEITVKRVPVRSAETELEVTLRWNRPARVRLVVIDEKNEPWIIPIGDRHRVSPARSVAPLPGRRSPRPEVCRRGRIRRAGPGRRRAASPTSGPRGPPVGRPHVGARGPRTPRVPGLGRVRLHRTRQERPGLKRRPFRSTARPAWDRVDHSGAPTSTNAAQK